MLAAIFLLVVVTVMPGPGAGAAPVDLELLTVASADVRVEFRQTYSGIAADAPEGWREGFCSPTDSYLVCADPEKIEPDRYRSKFSYTLYVEPRTAEGPNDVTRFRFLAEPLKPFWDQEMPVDFTVTAHGQVEEGTLRLPIHSTWSAEHFLGYRLQEVPVRLLMGGDKRIFIDLENRLPNLAVLVGDELRVTSNRPRLWESVPLAELEPPLEEGVEELRLRPGAKAPRRIRLVAKPVSGKALLASFVPYRPSAFGAGDDRIAGVHDRITFYVPYRTSGGLPQELPVEVPVRFWPSVWALLTAVFIGAVVGSVLPPLLGHGFANWWWEVAASVLMAWLAWLIALLLVAFDSQVRLLGLELDPYQLIPAVLLGVLVALAGPKGAPVLKRIPFLRRMSQGDDGGQRASTTAGGRE